LLGLNDALRKQTMNVGNFFAELKRRHVYRIAVAYVVVAWVLIQVVTQVFPFFEVPNWAVRLVVVLLVLGLRAYAGRDQADRRCWA
jgi:hypothetical protein